MQTHPSKGRATLHLRRMSGWGAVLMVKVGDNSFYQVQIPSRQYLSIAYNDAFHVNFIISLQHPSLLNCDNVTQLMKQHYSILLGFLNGMSFIPYGKLNFFQSISLFSLPGQQSLDLWLDLFIGTFSAVANKH